MSLEIREDIEVWDIIDAAVELVEFVKHQHNITTYEEWQCPYFRALVKSLYWEVEDGSDGQE